MKRKKAIFTRWHNEPVFGPLWLRYYGQFFEPSDIYIVHLLKPKPVEFDTWLADQTGFVRIPIQDKQVNDLQLEIDLAHSFQRKLLADYECVLVCDADEFVAHVAGLSAYIDAWDTNRQVEVCKGLEIVHHFNSEPPIDLSQPILSQRRWWRICHLYDKPLLSRIPLDWSYGFHFCEQVPSQTTDPNLLLIHLHKMDYGVCLNRWKSRMRNEDKSEATKDHTAGSPGWHKFIQDFDVRDWLSFDLDGGGMAQDTEIPEYVRRLPL